MNDSQPKFRGKDRDHWLNLRTSGEDEERWEAIDAIRHICVPEDSAPLVLDTIFKDPYPRSRGLASHALYDLAIDPSTQSLLRPWLPQIHNAWKESGDEDREQLQEVLDLLEGSHGSANNG